MHDLHSSHRQPSFRASVDHRIHQPGIAEGLGHTGGAFQLRHAGLQLAHPVGEPLVLLARLLKSLQNQPYMVLEMTNSMGT